ncbi:MAG: mechanosensitive ion channel domain-containing protein [Desulfobaccales bacterium]
MPLKGISYRFMMALAMVVVLVPPWPVRAQAAPPEKLEKGAAQSQTLLQGFEAGITHLQEDLKGWESRLVAAADKVAQTTQEMDHLQVAVASLKATMVLQKLPLPRVQELLAAYAGQEKELRGKIKDLSQEIDALKQDQQTQLSLQNALRVQLNIIQAKEPAALPPELEPAFLHYLALAGVRDALVVRVLDQLEQQRRLLQQEQELLVGLEPPLKQLEDAWKTELLKRPPEAVPLWQQVPRVWQNLATIPARGWEWLNDLIKSGRLSAFIWRHLAPIIGLLGFIVLLAWSTRRLNDLVTRRVQTWTARAEDSHLLSLYILGQTLVGNLFGLGLIFWLGLFFWTFNLLASDPGQLILALLVTLWALRLGLQTVQRFFAGQVGGGILTLAPDVARFYRRSLKLFLVYLCLGFFGLKSSGLLDFPESSRLFLEHFFLLGVLVWGWWLLRRPYLTRLLPELSDPIWLHRPWVSLFLRGLVLSLLAVIILADLLGFQNLSLYLTRAAAWTLLAAVLLWFLWLMGETIIRHLLHPEAGRATCRFPEKVELIERVYSFSRWALSLILGVAVVLWSLNSWGITPPQVAWAFRWMTWGATLGPVKLTTLSVIGVILALYLGFFLSRVVRSLMMMRIFPRTALDPGVQYTISTTVHYVILILAGLVALNILGFPLTNLLLVLGALGVGIGFGLQNIFNNFLSGLILLFERPIKVGDMLVIDGQWGLVKEIRVRSTIFETFDRYVMIIPNSELISNKVLNWTHYGAGINRLTLKVGISYGSDVRQVTRLLSEVCRANPRVVAAPPPQITFQAYGDSSLDFTIWVYLKTPSDRNRATHELNSAIFEAFNEHGIEIPFPRRDLHIKEWPEALEKKGDG